MVNGWLNLSLFSHWWKANNHINITSTINNQHQAQQSQWAITIYFILSIYYFGMVAATYAITYPGFGYMHEHFQAYVAVLNGKIDFWLRIPAALLAISELSLLRWSPGSFPRWAIWGSVGLVLISVSTTFLVLLPVLHAMPLAGFLYSCFCLRFTP